MVKRIYKKITILFIALFFLSAIVFFELYRDYRKNDIGLQLGCISSKTDLLIVRKFCKAMLFYAPWTQEQLDGINKFSTVSIAIQDASISPDIAEDYLRLFLKRGANINAQSQMGLRHQPNGVAIPSELTALHMAVMAASLEEVNLLLKYGADTTIKDERGKTALDLAEMQSSKWPENENYKKIAAALRK